MTDQRVGPYEVGEKLGEGGMGVVYCAYDTRLRRHVALKVLSSHERSPDGRKRFMREAQTASSLNHPGIVTIHDIGEHHGETYLVMEHVEGRSLRELISPGGMDPAIAVSHALQMADALIAAHAAGIVHRDLKPGNIMITADGRVKILDFGLAIFCSQSHIDSVETRTQFTAVNTFVGSVAYVSPEQSMNHPVDHRSDVFSLAVVLHEMLTGERPFEAKSTLELIFEINRGTPRRLRQSRPELPWSLEALLLCMLEKNPADRIQSMVMVRASLAAIEREIQHREVEAAVAGNPVERLAAPLEHTVSSEIGVAVFRFRAIPQGQQADAFSEGLASEIVQALGGIPGIRVASRLAASRFDEGKTPLEEIARTLGIVTC